MTRKIYLDSCIAIYLVEEHPVYAASIETVLSKCDGIVCYSPLTELECLVLPLRLKRTDLLDKFSRFFSLNLKLEIHEVIYKEATRLRADFGIKTPDALHLATARFHNCTELWTNDGRLAGVANSLAVDVVRVDAGVGKLV
jgi:predicted nucleic acid-binding protein